MTTARCLVVVVVAVALPTATARADDPLPSLLFQADPATKGAKLKVGFDLRRGTRPSLVISPFFQTTTDNGLATLFTLGASGASTSASWQLGAAVSKIGWRASEADRDAAGNSEQYAILERSSYDFCNAMCATPAGVATAAPFCDVRKRHHATLRTGAVGGSELGLAIANEAATDAAAKPVELAAKGDPNQIPAAQHLRALANAAEAEVIRLLDRDAPRLMSVTDYCPADKPVLTRYLRDAYDPWTAVPRHVHSIGFSAGLTTNTYVVADGTSTLQLVENELHTTQAAAASLVWIWPGITLEVPVRVERRFGLTTADTAKWCTPAGMVATPSGAVPAETCTEQPIGPLASTITLKGAVYGGTMAAGGFWRVSGGISGELALSSAEGARNAYKVGVQLPLYIGTQLLKKEANGLVRISLGAFRSQSAAGTKDVSLSVSLAILASPSLFAGPFDQP